MTTYRNLDSKMVSIFQQQTLDSNRWIWVDEWTDGKKDRDRQIITASNLYFHMTIPVLRTSHRASPCHHCTAKEFGKVLLNLCWKGRRNLYANKECKWPVQPDWCLGRKSRINIRRGMEKQLEKDYLSKESRKAKLTLAEKVIALNILTSA